MRVVVYKPGKFMRGLFSFFFGVKRKERTYDE